MENSEQSPSARGYLKSAGKSVYSAGLAPLNDLTELVYGPDPVKSGVCLAAAAAAAVVFPFPFFVAGILSTANAAANGTREKRYGPEKEEDAPAPVPAPAPAPAV